MTPTDSDALAAARRLLASAGGRARASRLTAYRRKAIARAGGLACAAKRLRIASTAKNLSEKVAVVREAIAYEKSGGLFFKP